MPLHKIVLPLTAATSLILSGCASLPADRGYGDVRSLLSARGGAELPAPEGDSRQRVAELLAEPLSADRAVAVGLLRNPELRAAYAQLGLAQADVLEASRLSNPTLSFSVLQSNAAGDRTRLDYGLVQNFTDLLFLSPRRRIAVRSLDSAKRAIAARIQTLAADIAAAQYRLVGAQQIAQMRGVVATAAEASSELAQRFHAAGNISELQWKREQATATQARLDTDAAEAEVLQARSALNRLMGLSTREARWTIEARLPEPVEKEDAVDSLVDLALKQRLDLAARQQELASLADVRSLARRLRWLPLLEVGVQGERETDGARLFGPSIAVQLPLFNQGQGSLARVQAQWEQSQAEAAALVVEIGNAVAAADDRMLAARARVDRHRTQLIPQREAVVARTQELQNYMIVGQFELLLAKQEEYDAYQGYLEALRDYWLARVELAHEVGAALPSDAGIGRAKTGAVVLPDQAPPAPEMEGMPGMEHGGHGAQPMPPMNHGEHGGRAMEPMDHGAHHDHRGQPPPQPAMDRPETTDQPVIQRHPVVHP